MTKKKTLKPIHPGEILLGNFSTHGNTQYRRRGDSCPARRIKKSSRGSGGYRDTALRCLALVILPRLNDLSGAVASN